MSRDLRHLTIILIAAMFISGGGLDTGLALAGGNRSTISRVWMDLSGQHPELIAELAYSLVLFFLHLCFARMNPPYASGSLRLALALIALIPVFRLVYVVATATPTDDAAYSILVQRRTWEMILLSIGGAAIAVPAWWFCVPQHVY